MKTECMNLEEQIAELKQKQNAIRAEASKVLNERLLERDNLLRKLETTNDMDFVLATLEKKDLLGGSSCSFYEFQAAARNKNLDEKVFNFLLNFHTGEQLLFNSGLSFEQRCRVLKLFWVERGR